MDEMCYTERDDCPALAPGAKSVLAMLRRRIRWYVWLEGCGIAAVWLAAAFWITLAADWLFEPVAAVRVAMLAAVAAVWAAVVFQLIARRAFVRITDGNAAMVLERRFPQLNDSLLTAVVVGGRLAAQGKLSEAKPQLAVAPCIGLTGGDSASDEMDREMLAQACREATKQIENVDLGQVFNARPLRIKCGAAAVLAVSMTVFAILFPDAFGVWARRTLAFSGELWPRRTRLEVEGFFTGIEKVARGSDFDVTARADAAMPWVPQVVEVRYRTKGGDRGRAAMNRRGIARGPKDLFQEYVYTFRNLLGDIDFDVVGGDDRVPNLRIQVVDSPTISQMTLDCRLPPYIGREESPLPVTGVMQLPMGSLVTVQAAAANKELIRVEAQELVDGHTVPEKVLERVSLSVDHRGFSLGLPPIMKDMTLQFLLTDMDGIRGRDPVRLALVAMPDQPPQLAVQLDGIDVAITPQARLPLVGRITDDYGLDKAWFEYTVDQRKQSRCIVREFSDRPTEFQLANAVLELRELGLKPGEKLSLAVGAADLCDLGHGANEARSQRWALDVVTADQLRTMLQLRELLLRQRFERMIQEMTETRDVLVRLEIDLPDTRQERTIAPDDDTANSPARRFAMRVPQVHGALTNCRSGAEEIVGLAEAFDDLRKQLVNNRIDTEELKERLQAGIAEPLRRISDPMFPQLEHALAGLLAALNDAKEGPTLRDRGRQQADEIILAMRKVLDRMIELEDFNEAVEMLRNVIKLQAELSAAVQERQKQMVRELLEERVAKQTPERGGPGREGKLALEEQRIAENYRHFEDVLLRMAELGAAQDPSRAALLKKAVAQSKEQLISLRLERLAELLGKDQFSRALEVHSEVYGDLHSLLELLMSEDRVKRISDDKARFRKYLNRLGRMIAQQKDVQGRTAGGDNPAQLRGEQEQLVGKAKELVDDIQTNEEAKEESGGQKADNRGPRPQGGERKAGEKPDGGNPPSDQTNQASQGSAINRLEAARQRMKEAEEKLRDARRGEAGEKQEQAIRELQLAKAQLEQILRQLREEEIERTLASLESRFRLILQMQEVVYEGTVRLASVGVGQRTHSHEIEANRLSGKESEIVVGIDKALLLLQEDGSAAALLEAAGEVRYDAHQLASRFAQTKVDTLTQGMAEDIIAALKEIIASLKQAQKDLEKNGQAAGEPSPPGGLADQPLVELLAELKMIRAMQMRINVRTARYAKMIEGEQAQTAGLIEVLRQLAERQEQLRRVTRDIQTGKNE
jgi:hypothetical protein